MLLVFLLPLPLHWKCPLFLLASLSKWERHHPTLRPFFPAREENARPAQNTLPLPLLFLPTNLSI